MEAHLAIWLSIITVDVLPMAHSVRSSLVARDHQHRRLAAVGRICGDASRCRAKFETDASCAQMSFSIMAGTRGDGTVRVRVVSSSISGS